MIPDTLEGIDVILYWNCNRITSFPDVLSNTIEDDASRQKSASKHEKSQKNEGLRIRKAVDKISNS
jgi:hypothetical protein